MKKLALNQLRLDLRIRPKTALLIKAGDKGLSSLHPERPDMTFVRTGPRATDTVYLPGASLKGVVRAAAERVLRSVEVRCCDPLDARGPCQKLASERGDKIARSRELRESAHPFAEVYASVCYACRTFGSQAVASRALFSDAMPASGEERELANRTEERSGVSIDRRTGGPARGKLFSSEVVTGGSFDTSLHLENFQLWQAGLLWIVLSDLKEGFVRLGSAKSRGLGHVDVEIRGGVYTQRGTTAGDEIRGVSALADGLDAYAFVAPEADRAAGFSQPQTVGLFGARKWEWRDEPSATAFLDACVGAPWEAFCERAERP